MNSWSLEIELWLAKLWRGSTAVAITCAVAAVLWTLAVPDAQEKATSAVNQLRELRTSAAKNQADETPHAQPHPLSAFEERLASTEGVNSLMASIWKTAESGGLLLSKVDYQAEQDRAAPFGRLSIKLPVAGTYPAIRKFAFSLMTEFPGLSLDKLDMKLSQPASGTVEATVHFTLLTRP